MKTNTVKRRDILAAVGTASTISLSNGVQAVKTGETTHLVEAGIEFSIPEGRYRGTRLDGNPVYYLDGEKDTIALYPSNSPDRDTIINNDHVIATRKTSTGIARVGPQNERRIITRLSGYRRPVQSVLLNSALTEMATVSVSGQSTDIQTGDEIRSLPVGESIKLTLPSHQLTAITRVNTDEVVSVDGVPDYRESTPMINGTAEIIAKPTLMVKNWGEMKIAEITSN